MGYISILLIAFALSLDAFSVAITCGIKLNGRKPLKYLKIAIMFGLFQAIMPLGGWLIGDLFKDTIGGFADWLSFGVFLSLGLKTLYDASHPPSDDSPHQCNCQSLPCLLSLAIATSIDAFLVGLIIALYSVPIYVTLGAIGVVTLVLTYIGCLIGHKANAVLKRSSQVIAGFILIALAVKSFM